MDIVYENLCDIAGKENISLAEDMKKHTTFKAGGAAKYFAEPETVKQLAALLVYLNENHINYYIIGNGSNLLVQDKGFDGVIVKIGSKMGGVLVNGEEMICEAGAFVAKAANLACEHSLRGLEFAAGIPGMIGGAVTMNAGAYGGEFKDIIEEVWMLDDNGMEICKTADQMEFGYRSSIIQKKHYVVTRLSFD